MCTDDLHSILELGWQSSREAWQLLAPNDDGEFTMIGASQTGRSMDQLARDLWRIGYPKPARLAHAAGFVLNNLACGAIPFEPEIAEKTSQIVTVLAEMLLELEAAKEITIQEPVEIVEELKANWGLRFEAHDPDSTTTPPELNDEVDAPLATDDEELVAISEELFQVSGSLLDRVIREGEFPHTAALGRIHHLAALVRGHVVTEPHIHRAIEFSGYAEELRLGLPELDFHEKESPLPLVESTDPLQSEAPKGNLPPGVLILDQSPFIRMLLTTAIESAGYVAVATADWANALNDEPQRPWSILICGITELIEDRELLARRAESWQASIITFDEGGNEPIGPWHYQLPRTDLEGLLGLIKSKLGPIDHPMLMSA